jgi:phosphohistidine swiveling domain-containing protein
MTNDTMRATPVTFDPPGPGFWELESSHHGLRPLSPFLRDTYLRAGLAGFQEMLERYGLPLASIQGEKPGAAPSAGPPPRLLKVLVRVHPTLRRRARTARQAIAERRWRQEVDQWFDHDRAAQLEADRALQAIDPAALDDHALATHLTETLAHFGRGARRNTATHGGDLVPVGDYVAWCQSHGVEATEAVALLAGSSPATTETAVLLAPVAAAISRSRIDPASLTSVDQIRALGPEVAAAVDAWSELHLHRTVTTDDVDRPTLAESPTRQLRALLAATETLDVPASDVTAVRSKLTAADASDFDERLAEARYGLRQRDDIRGLCWDWPCGLVRRALVEAGRRLQADGRLLEIDHVVETRPDELDRLLRAESGPSAAELGDRAAERDRIEATPPPRSLGEPEPEPPIDVFPEAMARLTAAMMAVLAVEGTPPASRDADPSAVTGVGVGTAPYQGRACVVRDLMSAFDQLEHGDVLVASVTGPSINSLLPAVGALVVEEGGAICHAAIAAREFGLPAVVGAQRATAVIPHGAMVEVDPVAGTVRVV